MHSKNLINNVKAINSLKTDKLAKISEGARRLFQTLLNLIVGERICRNFHSNLRPLFRAVMCLMMTQTDLVFHC
jgi:hypothetical protein